MKVKILIGLIISALFLFLAFHSVDFDRLYETLQQTNYFYLLPATILIYISVYFRAVRWQYFLNPIKKVPVRSLFSAMSIGLMANSLLPARMGELVFAWVIGQKENISKTSAFATIVVSRVFDGVTIFLMLLLILFFMPMEDPALVALKYSVIIIYSLAIIFILTLYFAQKLVLTLIRKVFFFLSDRILDKITDLLLNFIEGLHVLKDLKGLMLASLFSVILWVFAALSYAPVIYAFPFEEQLPLWAPFFMLSIVAFGVMLPSAPGFVGVFHFACTLSIALMAPGISEDSAAGFALIIHVAQIFPVIILGLLLLWKEGLSLTNLKQTQEDHGK